MALNITNIVNAVNAKNTNADSNTSDTEIRLVNTAITLLNGTDGVITYKSRAELPAPDSANNGQFVFIPATAQAFLDSYGDGTFFWSSGDSWNPVQLVREAVANEASVFYNTAGSSTSSEFYQGTTSGYMSGGYASSRVNTIDKWSFSSDGNATDVGDVTVARERGSGQSSNVSGYTSGGVGNSLPTVNSNTIDKFPFAADGNATDVGDLTGYFRTIVGQSSENHGYSSGGHQQPVGATNVIQKFPFASDGNATDVGDRTLTGQSGCGQNSTTSGYTSGGSGGSPPSPTNVIDKFTFATDQNATDVGDLISTSLLGGGQSSSTHGYVSGGRIVPVMGDVIQKFSFSSDGNATDVGDLLVAAFYLAGQSSNVSGYVSGGTPTPSQNIIQKFPFPTDANSTDVGDLTQSRYGGMGQQV